jgi:hypothetical protein
MAETVICKRCGDVNPSEARFCIDCGASLVAETTGPTVRLAGVACPSCNTRNPENALFCVVCGRTLGQSAPQPQPQPPRATPRPVAPNPAARQSYPRVATPPTLVPPRPVAPPYRHRRARHANPGAAIFLIGLAVLLGSGRFWPGILVVIGLSIFATSAAQGHAEKGTSALLWLGGLALLFATGAFWPGILVLLFVQALMNGWSGSRGWHW